MHSDGRSGATALGGGEDLAKYVADRLQELRPGKRAGVAKHRSTTCERLPTRPRAGDQSAKSLRPSFALCTIGRGHRRVFRPDDSRIPYPVVGATRHPPIPDGRVESDVFTVKRHLPIARR